ncbi:MAG: AAA family ATPase, partial [Bacteroidota bacterium]
MMWSGLSAGSSIMIENKVSRMAYKHDMVMNVDAIRETVRLQKRYAPYSGFPGKPIRFLETLVLNKLKRVDRQNAATKIVERKDVIQHFCEEAGMPKFMIDPDVPMDLEAIQGFFESNIFGQFEATKSVVDLLASVKTALTRQGKPIASFLFVGPTGVGKTEMAKVLAQFMFGNRERMIRFDMSEYSNPWSIQRLTGESYFQDGTLTSAIRREPFCVLLFDEIEKAHPLFYDLLLQLLSEGRLTDSQGKLVNFCSTIIIMTSNIGAANLQSDRIGWNQELDIQLVEDHFMSAVEKHFRPELFNRIDKIVPFSPITPAIVTNVIQREIGLLHKREGISHRKMDFKIDPAVVEYLAKAGYDPKYGARKLQRTLHEQVVVPLANQLNFYDFDDQLIVGVQLIENQPKIIIEADPLKIDLLLEELARNEWTDHVSNQRRSFYKLQEGRFYIQLLSKLDIFERDQKRLKEKFWQNERAAEQYSFYLTTKERVDNLAKLIESFEQELALTAMDLRHYDTTIIKRTEDWEKAYLDLKLDLYDQIDSSSNHVYLKLLGFQIQQFFPIILKVLELNDFKVAIDLVWYR